MTHAQSVLLDIFNARFLGPEEVAKSFVPPKFFDRISARSHLLLTGPRGSGKTTLLKMLQLPALAAWQSVEATRFRSQIDYLSAFVPADRSWSAPFAVSSPLREPERSMISESTFMTHVCLAVIRAFQQSIHATNTTSKELEYLWSTLSADRESRLVGSLAEYWRLEDAFPSLDGIREALLKRLNRLGELWQMLRRDRLPKTFPEAEEFRFLFLDFSMAIGSAVAEFGSAVNARQRYFCIAFDELEIAPEEIRRALIVLLRSTESQLVFKLAHSPHAPEFTDLSQPTMAKSQHDFEKIELWYAHKERARDFCNELLAMLLRSHGLGPERPEALFDVSDFDIGRIEEHAPDSAYAPGGEVHRRFESLAEKDPTFARYLRRSRVELSEMHRMRDAERASALRRITSLVAVRNEFRRPQERGQKGRRRPRKTNTLYTGALSLFAMSEGNPRMFLSIMSPLVESYAGARRPVPRRIQNRAVLRALKSFLALLNTIPVPGKDGAKQEVALLDLVEEIGTYLNRCVIVDSFHPEPHITFRVDDDAHPSLREAVGIGVNVGAFVHAPDKDPEELLGDLRGKRFRLSYLLASHYRLPLSIGSGKSRAISRIVGAGIERQEIDLFTFGSTQASEVTAGV